MAGIDNRAHLDAALGAAIGFTDDSVLRHVDKTAGEIPRVRRFERRVSQAFSRTVRRIEVLEHIEAFLEVRDDRALDDLTGRLRHQTAHRRKLLHLCRRPTRPGMGHHVNGIYRLVAPALVLLHGRNAVHHLGGETVRALGPSVNYLIVLLALSYQAILILLLVILYERAGLLNDRPLVFRHHHVVLAERNAGLERMVKAERHNAVAEDNRLLLTAVPIHGVDHAGDFLLRHKLVDDVEGHFRVLRQHA